MYLFGTSYVYFVDGGYYTLLTDYVPYLVNLAAWLGFAIACALLSLLTVIIIKCSRKLKHS